MIKPSINLQELRRRIYRKAKAEKTWRFWGLYVHVFKLETLRAAYQEAKANDGAPGLDGVSFEDIESQGGEEFLTTFNGNFSLGPTSQVRTGGWRFLKRQAKPEGSEFPLSKIGLSKER